MLIRIDKQFTGEFERKISAFARKCLKFGIDFEWKKVEESTDFIYVNNYDRKIDGTPEIRIIHGTETELLQEIRKGIYNSLYPSPVVVY